MACSGVSKAVIFLLPFVVRMIKNFWKKTQINADYFKKGRTVNLKGFYSRWKSMI